MREEPSSELITNLRAAGLATREQILAARRHARRLARDLPLFESVWVDALVQTGVLTHYQATQINAGRVDSLRAGPYVLRNAVSPTSCGTLFVARNVETGEDRWLVVLDRPQIEQQALTAGLETLCTRTAALETDAIVALDAAGVSTSGSAQRSWVACPKAPGVSAADWMVPEGRFPPEAVLEVARQMAGSLAELERVDVVHGDICARGLVLQPSGEVRIHFAGLRPLVRAHEGYSHAQRHTDTYDYLAPERVADGTPPSVASDLYACGLLWWHMLTGRPPLAGGNALAKLRAAQAARFMDVERLAPETPEVLVGAIRRCTAREPAARPASFAKLTELLGAPTDDGAAVLARCLNSQAPLRSRLVTAAVTVRRSRNAPVWSAALAGCLLMAAAISLPYWGSRLPVASIGTSGDKKTTVPEDPTGTEENGSAVEPIQQSDAETIDDSGKRTFLPGQSDLAPKSSDLILPADKVTHLEASQLQAGQTIRADDGQRARVVTPADGLTITVEDLRFENIDFVASFLPADQQSTKNSPVHVHGKHVKQSIIALGASRVTFRGCSFQPEPAASVRCAAIVWQGSADNRLDRLPAVGRLRLVDCTLGGVAVGIDVHRRGPLEIELENSLHVASGSLVQLQHDPGVEESISLSLKRCTSRGAIALFDWHVDRVPATRGNIFINADDSVFALQENGSLLRLTGLADETELAAFEELLSSVVWTGYGSLLGSPGQFAVWQDEQGRLRPIDDSATTVDGLVLSRIEFAGDADGDPAASRVVDWSAPLRGDRSPGVSASLLVLPNLR